MFHAMLSTVAFSALDIQLSLLYSRLGDRPFHHRLGTKLDPVMEGPFEVQEVLSPHRVKLKLPPDMKIEPIVDASQLATVPPDDEFGRPGLRAESSEDKWEPERIVEERLFDGRYKQFKVKWKKKDQNL